MSTTSKSTNVDDFFKYVRKNSEQHDSNKSEKTQYFGKQGEKILDLRKQGEYGAKKFIKP